jgi:predicted permease
MRLRQWLRNVCRRTLSWPRIEADNVPRSFHSAGGARAERAEEKAACSGQDDRSTQLECEIESHLQMATRDRMERGQSADDASHAARREFGNVSLIQEVAREQRGSLWFHELLQDLRYAARTLRNNPGFTLVAVLTLALGIGANTAIFSMIEAVLLRPLPYPNADQLVMVWEDVRLPHYQDDRNTPAPGNYTDWKAQNSVFSEMAAIGYRSFSLTGSGEPVRIEGEAYSADIFSVLQVYPILGRAFTPEEDREGGPHVAILSYGLWMSRFGGDRGIIDRTIRLNEESYAVVGVMPPGFAFPDRDDQIWIPLALTNDEITNRGSHYLRVVARLKPGVTQAQAQSEMRAIGARMTAQYPNSNTGVDVNVVSLHEQVAGSLRRPLLVLTGVVGFVLLIACANLANLLLARASVRARELAIRSALGASRTRLIRQLLTESLLLALLGGAVGLGVAFGGLDLIRYALSAGQTTWYTPSTANLAEAGLNFRVGAFCLAISLLAGFGFGLLPAFRSSRRQVAMELKDRLRGSSSSSQSRLRGLLIIAETALCVIVLVSAGLLLRSFVRLQQIPIGFESENVLSARVILPQARYSKLEARSQFYRQVLDRIRTVPGVHSAAGITFLPLTMQGRTTGIFIEEHPSTVPGQLPFADFRSVSPDYFSTMRIPLLAGRDFSWSDTAQTSLVAIVSETMAHDFWPGESAIGKRFSLGGPRQQPPAPWITVVGVVGNVQQLELIKRPRPAMYFPATQDAGTGDSLRDWVIRGAGDPTALTAGLRSAIWAVDPSLPISRIQSMEQVRSAVLGPQQLNFSLTGVFGILALMLAAVGLYGVTSYSVAQRTQEIGIRVALGAPENAVLRLIIGQGVRLALVGLAIGTAAALALSRLMSSLLYGVTPRDPLTFVGVALVLAAVALLASYLPARRATRVDPIVALRCD